MTTNSSTSEILTAEIKPLRLCRNCDYPMTGEFCAACGQKDMDVRQSVFSFLKGLVRVIFEIDGRAYRTLFALLTRPGFLTQEYFAGRRVKYTHPLRMFLVISIIFFLTISVLTTMRSVRQAVAEAATNSTVEATENEVQPEGNARRIDQIASEEDFGDILTFFAELEFPFLSARINQNLQAAVTSQLRTNLQEVMADPRDFFIGSLENITLFQLLMMPILALIQQMLWVFSRRYFVEHLILVLHNQTFLVLMSLLAMILGVMGDAEIPLISSLADLLSFFGLLWILAYLYLSLKQTFMAHWAITLALFTTASIAYLLVLSIGMMAFAMMLVLFA